MCLRQMMYFFYFFHPCLDHRSWRIRKFLRFADWMLIQKQFGRPLAHVESTLNPDLEKNWLRIFSMNSKDLNFWGDSTKILHWWWNQFEVLIMYVRWNSLSEWIFDHQDLSIRPMHSAILTKNTQSNSQNMFCQQLNFFVSKIWSIAWYESIILFFFDRISHDSERIAIFWYMNHEEIEFTSKLHTRWKSLSSVDSLNHDSWWRERRHLPIPQYDYEILKSTTYLFRYKVFMIQYLYCNKSSYSM